MAESPESCVRTEGQIRQQLKQVLYRHLQRLLRNNFKKTPESCCFNRREPLGDTGQKVGVCRWNRTENKEDLKVSPRGKLCDSRVFGCSAVALMCPWWGSLQSKDAIKAEFRALLASDDRGRIAASYPDVAALMWVLDGVDIQQALADAEFEADPPVDTEST